MDYTEFVYNGKEFQMQCHEYGINLHFPKCDMTREIRVTVRPLNVSSDDCSLPNDAELVSAAYRIEASEQLPSPVVVEIQHCIQLSDKDDTSVLSFVRSNSDCDPPYQFKTLQGGQFSVNTRYGGIKLLHFSDIAIVCFFKRLLSYTRSLVCSANVFSRMNSPSRYDVHVVVTKHLANVITVSFDVHVTCT